MKFRLYASILGLTLLMMTALGSAALVSAATPSDGENMNAKTTKTGKTVKAVKSKKKSTKVKFDKGSGETAAERDRRMQRECKGRPNAGACLGYGS